MKFNGLKKRKTYTFQPTKENYTRLNMYKKFGEKSKKINQALTLFLRASNNEKKSKIN